LTARRRAELTVRLGICILPRCVERHRRQPLNSHIGLGER
jgi:hypothetical protein